MRRIIGRILTSFSPCLSDFLIPSEESCPVIMILDGALETRMLGSHCCCCHPVWPWASYLFRSQFFINIKKKSPKKPRHHKNKNNLQIENVFIYIASVQLDNGTPFSVGFLCIGAVNLTLCYKYALDSMIWTLWFNRLIASISPVRMAVFFGCRSKQQGREMLGVGV